MTSTRLDALETGVQELRSEIRGIDNRLTTVEAEVRSTNVQLERMHTEQQEAAPGAAGRKPGHAGGKPGADHSH